MPLAQPCRGACRALQEYHRVVAMEDFMRELAPTVWPPEERHMYCYHFDRTEEVNCHTKQGNPFGPFWDGFQVDFVGDRGVRYGMSAYQWSQEVAPAQHPVVAMSGLTCVVAGLSAWPWCGRTPCSTMQGLPHGFR
jgi:hypothetical protein